jgi:hypothetical protein
MSKMMDVAKSNLKILLSDVAEPEAPVAPVESPPEKATEKDKSALEDAFDDADPKDENGGVKPPEDGKCRECKRLRRLNRLKLCYPCFAELVLAEEAKKRGHPWKPGDPHPDFCACEGLGEHKNADGTARGFN